MHAVYMRNKNSDRPLTLHEMLFDSERLPCVNVQIMEHWISTQHFPFLQIVLFHSLYLDRLHRERERIRRFYLQFILVIKNHAITLIALIQMRAISRHCAVFLLFPSPTRLYLCCALIVWHTSRNAHDIRCVFVCRIWHESLIKVDKSMLSRPFHIF